VGRVKDLKLTLGVEEEYLVVDPVTRAVVPDGPEVAQQALWISARMSAWRLRSFR
jgi:hypothetical protein